LRGFEFFSLQEPLPLLEFQACKPVVGISEPLAKGSDRLGRLAASAQPKETEHMGSGRIRIFGTRGKQGFVRFGGFFVAFELEEQIGAGF